VLVHRSETPSCVAVERAFALDGGTLRSVVTASGRACDLDNRRQRAAMESNARTPGLSPLSLRMGRRHI
jgi:hypothetical protein